VIGLVVSKPIRQDGGAELAPPFLPRNSAPERCMKPTKTFPASIADFLRVAAYWWHVTFDVIAGRAAENFGAAAPTVDEVATFIGQFRAGKMHVNRLHRDPAMAAFVRRRRASGDTIDAVHAACARTFGPYRTPSRSVLARYLHLAGARWRSASAAATAQAPDLDPWLTLNAANMTLSALHAACAAKFGSKVAPSRSALHRRLRRLGVAAAGKRGRLAQHPELAAWMAAEWHNGTLDQWHAAGVAKFGTVLTPSRSALHRYRRRQQSGKGRR
jgi:hypothetical protein